jgi:hypothetical protein
MKKYGKYAAIAFVAWYLLAQPTKAAGVVHGTLNRLGGAANSLSVFVGHVP